MASKNDIIKFLVDNGMYVDDIDFMDSYNKFLAEMESGLEGKGTLAMIPTYIGVPESFNKKEPVIAIDAGGTNFRIALVTFDQNHNPVIDNYSKYKMPGVEKEISSDEFFSKMGEFIKPFAGKSSKIGFCFSYPVEIMENKDGKILYLSKELKVKNIEGQILGESIKNATGLDDSSVVVLNDTVAALLGGVAAYPMRKFSSYIGFILGTGTNTAYIEKNSNIIKSESISKSSGSMIINMESGGYCNPPRGRIDEIFDENTANPGVHLFEKMFSGAYLGQLYLTTLKEASSNGLFSSKCSKIIEDMNTISTEEADNFLFYPFGNISNKDAGGSIDKNRGHHYLSDIFENEDDKSTAYYLADNLFTRGALMAAVNLAAVIKKSGGDNPLLPVGVLTEGSAYFNSKLLKNRIDYYVHKYINRELSLYADFLKADNVTITGSAIAGLL